jgi:hypothetical protein
MLLDVRIGNSKHEITKVVVTTDDGSGNIDTTYALNHGNANLRLKIPTPDNFRRIDLYGNVVGSDFYLEQYCDCMRVDNLNSRDIEHDGTFIIRYAYGGWELVSGIPNYYSVYQFPDMSFKAPRTMRINLYDDHRIEINSVATTENGTIKPLGITRVKSGADFTWTIIPDDGYTVDECILDGNPVTPIKI